MSDAATAQQPLQQQAAFRSAARRRESEERYRELVESIDDVLAVFDPDGRVTYISPPVKRLLGFEPGELIGQRFVDLVTDEDTAKVADYFRRGRDGQGTASISELRMKHRNGSVRWVRSSAQPVYAARVKTVFARIASLSAGRSSACTTSTIENGLS